MLAALYKAPASDEARKFAKYTLKKYYRDAEHRDAVTLTWDFMMAEVRILRIMPHFYNLMTFHKTFDVFVKK